MKQTIRTVPTWTITADHIGGPDILKNRKGRTYCPRGFEPADDKPFRFKLYDDDGVLYYEGVCNEDAFEDLLDWAQNDAGATRLDASENGEPFETIIG